MEHLVEYRGAGKIVVIDGDAESVIQKLYAAGWQPGDDVEYVGNELIRYFIVPVA